MDKEIFTDHEKALLFESEYGHSLTKQQLTVFSILQPKLYKDGNQWCCLYGSNIQEGVVGFGDTPHQAVLNWDNQWFNEKILTFKTTNNE